MLYNINMTGKDVMKTLRANGWTLIRTIGSHHIFTKPGRRNVAVPLHGNRDMGFLAARILKEAGIN
jgi:predicted RNA binding protein YcfA (HicA-like mRNA interferase family)